MKKTKKTAAKAPAAVVESKTEVKEEVKAPAETRKAMTEKENAAKVEEKPAEETKETKTVKKPAAKKPVIKESVYLQYQGREISQQDLVKQVKEIWTKQLKKKVGEIKSISIYLKPEENTAYYVVNDDVTGSIAL